MRAMDFILYVFLRMVVRVDNQLPCTPKSTLLFARCKDTDEFWVPIVEKAYAKQHGAYCNIESGVIRNGLVDLTGGVGTVRDIKSEDANSDDLWNLLTHHTLPADEDDATPGNKIEYLFGVSKSGDSSEVEIGNTGLLLNHAYGIIRVEEADGNRLIEIRNPWGRKDWTGRWSNNSPEWTK